MPRLQMPVNLADKFNAALELHQRGQLDQAESLYKRILKKAPNQPDTLHYLGVLEAQRNHHDSAIRLIGRAVDADPKNAVAHLNLGKVFRSARRYDSALAKFDRALVLDPDYVDAHMNRGIALCDLGRHKDALSSFERALAIKYDHADTHMNRGVALYEMGRYEEALQSLDQALKFNLYHAEALFNRGRTLRKLKRLQEAVASYDLALLVAPGLAASYYNRGNALFDIRKHEDAIISYERALAIEPNYAEALYSKGNALQNLRRLKEAVTSYDRALFIKPNHFEALFKRGLALARAEEYELAAQDFERLVRVQPDYEFAKGELLHARMHCCDWDGFDELAEVVTSEVRSGKRTCAPFGFQAVSHSPAHLFLCSRTYADTKYPASPSPLWKGETYRNSKIRVGYVSGEFREQATSYLMAGLFELQDRNRFELFGFDNGYDDASPMRKRVEAAFDVFHDISVLSDDDAARLIYQNQVDILVNLNGYFGYERTGVFSQRPCPVQVNYLGFPATMGADYMDYIIADRHVIAEDEHQHYSEKVIYLPDCYQANDSQRRNAEGTPSRSAASLPESGFVFCCFNNTYKLTPAIFEVWMRLLHKIQNSVLWLLKANDAVTRNLRTKAEQLGIAAERIVFAPRVSVEHHLARHQLADLFLDTLPYNAHTTASDALWAGIPIVTCSGTSFPGRVATSLLHAIGLSELITHSMSDYEALALKLATDSKLLAEIKCKLARNVRTYPLFDTKRFCRHIEAAYTTMAERYQRGEAPESFAVTPVN